MANPTGINQYTKGRLGGQKAHRKAIAKAKQRQALVRTASDEISRNQRGVSKTIRMTNQTAMQLIRSNMTRYRKAG